MLSFLLGFMLSFILTALGVGSLFVEDRKELQEFRNKERVKELFNAEREKENVDDRNTSI